MAHGVAEVDRWCEECVAVSKQNAERQLDRGDRSRDRSPRRSQRVNIHATATARATVHATAVSPRIARIKHV